ncbi:MAG: DUF262 domain-containing protein [Planctomycetaceae bacterium]|jgi:hypothetical protein|nr:DUF262 domain-containing protein [Planctomycetaceae bacterium]
MPTKRLKIDRVKVSELVEQFKQGRLTIPEFQRGYVWKPGKAPKLVDSLYRNFPISALLMWESNESVRSRSTEKKTSGRTHWLIDGQQRVTTLTKIIDGEIAVVFNPTDEEFQLENAATKQSNDWLYVAEILDKEEYRKIRQRIRNDKIEDTCDNLRNILDYEVPVVIMEGHTADEAKLAFQRINQQGTKLKLDEIAAADVAAKHSGLIADNVVPFIDQLHIRGFDRINQMHLFRVCGFIANPDTRSHVLLRTLQTKDVKQAWEKTQKATEKVINFVLNQFGLQDMELLRSASLLVPAIVLFDKWSVSDRDVEGLAGWIALASIFHRYSGSSETALDQDLQACKTSDPIGALLKNLRQRRQNLTVTPANFGGYLQDRGALFAAYLACRHRGCKDFFTGSKSLVNNDIDQHHILPRAGFSKEERRHSDTIANFAFISSETNRSIGDAAPSTYLVQIKESYLESQCIPLNKELWDVERADDFWKTRRELLTESFNEYVREKLPRRTL